MSSSPNSSSSEPSLSIDAFVALNDVVCRVDVMLGSAAMSVRECIGLHRDAIVSLPKPAGGDLEVIVNGILIAYGEVVIVDESTAIRVTELVAPPSSESAE